LKYHPGHSERVHIFIITVDVHSICIVLIHISLCLLKHKLFFIVFIVTVYKYVIHYQAGNVLCQTVSCGATV